MARRTLITVVAFLALALAACTKREQCDVCGKDSDCRSGLLCSSFNEIIALDPATGAEAWRHDPKVATDRRPANRFNCRGVSDVHIERQPAPASGVDILHRGVAEVLHADRQPQRHARRGDLRGPAQLADGEIRMGFGNRFHQVDCDARLG